MEGTDIRTENEPEGRGEIFRRWQGAKGRLWCSQGAWRGPVQQVGERKSGGRHGRRAVLLKTPALPETTDCHPTPGSTSSLPPHPQLNTRWVANPSLSLSEGWGVEREMQGGMILLLGRAQRGAGPAPWPVLHGGCREGQKSPFPTPSPGLGGCPQPTTIPCPAPARSPPNNNQMKRKRCHLPMPALRVSKPSGMGGARQLLGAWRGGGLPGGGHGTAYLEPPSLPEHAHQPHTHHHGVS